MGIWGESCYTRKIGRGGGGGKPSNSRGVAQFFCSKNKYYQLGPPHPPTGTARAPWVGRGLVFHSFVECGGALPPPQKKRWAGCWACLWAYFRESDTEKVVACPSVCKNGGTEAFFLNTQRGSRSVPSRPGFCCFPPRAFINPQKRLVHGLKFRFFLCLTEMGTPKGQVTRPKLPPPPPPSEGGPTRPAAPPAPNYRNGGQTPAT